MRDQRYTASELLAVMSSRLLSDGQIVFAGVGIPLLAATLVAQTAVELFSDPALVEAAWAEFRGTS